MKALLILLLSQFAAAEVNPVNGSFYYVVNLTPSVNTMLPSILINYDHQSQFQGLFGRGWCSDLDSRLAVESNSGATLQACGGGMVMRFEKFDDQFLTIGKTKPSAYPRIKKMRDEFVLERSPMDRTKFNKDGRLVSIEKMEKTLTLEQTGEEWVGRDSNNKTVLNLRMGANRQVSRAQYQNRQVQFSYDKNLLSSITDVSGGKSWTFKYEAQGRMVSASGPTGKPISIKYSKQFNLVEQIKDGACSTDLKYSMANNDEYGLETVAKCAKKTEKLRYKFVVSGNTISTEIKNDKGQVIASQVEDKASGKLLSELKPDGLTYSFNEDRLLVLKSSKAKKVRYTYEGGNVSEVEVGDRFGYRQAKLRYDRKDNLRGVELGERIVDVATAEAGMELKSSKAKLKFVEGRPLYFFDGKHLNDTKGKWSFTQAKDFLNLGYAMDILKERESAYVF